MTQPAVLCSPCGVPGSVTDHGHASRRLSALTADMYGVGSKSQNELSRPDLAIMSAGGQQSLFELVRRVRRLWTVIERAEGPACPGPLILRLAGQLG